MGQIPGWNLESGVWSISAPEVLEPQTVRPRRGLGDQLAPTLLSKMWKLRNREEGPFASNTQQARGRSIPQHLSPDSQAGALPASL